MKKILPAFFALSLFFSACSKDETPFIPEDRFSFNSETTLGLPDIDVNVINFYSTNDLSVSNLFLEEPTRFISSKIDYTGKTAKITTSGRGDRFISVIYIQADGFKHVLSIPIKYK